MYDTSYGDIIVTKSGKYYKNCGDIFRNELGQVCSPDYGESYRILKEFPYLKEYQNFYLSCPKSNNPPPSNDLIFITDEGFRFKCFLSIDYKISIPFLFRTKDSRVEFAEAKWNMNTGKVFNYMNNKIMYFSYKEKPVLHCIISTLIHMEIPSI